MALKIQIRPHTKSFCAQQRVDHTNDLGTFFINRGCVKVINLNKRVWPYRVRHRARVFSKLDRAQQRDILYPLDRW